MHVPELDGIAVDGQCHPRRRRRAPGRAAGLARTGTSTSRCSRSRCRGSVTRRRARAARSAARSRSPTRAPNCRLCWWRSGGEVDLSSQAGRTRRMAADDFFTGLMSTARDDDELIEAVRFPVPAAGRRLRLPRVRAAARRLRDRGLRGGRRRERHAARRRRRGRSRRSRATSATLDGSALDDALDDFAWDLEARDDLHATAALSPRPGPPARPRDHRGGAPMPRLSAAAPPSRPLRAQRPRRRSRGRAAHAADRFPAPRAWS